MALIETLKKRVTEWQRNNPLEYQQFTNEGWLFDMSRQHVIDIWHSDPAANIMIRFNGIVVEMIYQYNGLAVVFKMMKTEDDHVEFHLTDQPDDFMSRYFSTKCLEKFKTILQLEILTEGLIVHVKYDKNECL